MLFSGIPRLPIVFALRVARWQVAGATKSPLVFYIVKWGGVLLPLKLEKKLEKIKVLSWAITTPKIVG